MNQYLVRPIELSLLSEIEDLAPVEIPPCDPLKVTRFRTYTKGLSGETIHHHDPKIEIDDWAVCSKEGLMIDKSIVKPGSMSDSKRT